MDLNEQNNTKGGNATGKAEEASSKPSLSASDSFCVNTQIPHPLSSPTAHPHPPNSSTLGKLRSAVGNPQITPPG